MGLVMEARSDAVKSNIVGVFKSLWEASPGELLFGAPCWIFPLKGKNGLGYLGKADAKECILEI